MPAIEMATELGRAAGEREVEVGPVVEGWDLHGGTRPKDAPYRFLLLVKADAAFEAGAALPAAVRALLDRWKRDGVLQSDTTLAPTTTAVRTKMVAGKRTWTDGPFTESKELVAGFSILEVPTLADAKRFTESTPRSSATTKSTCARCWRLVERVHKGGDANGAAACSHGP